LTTQRFNRFGFAVISYVGRKQPAGHVLAALRANDNTLHTDVLVALIFSTHKKSFDVAEGTVDALDGAVRSVTMRGLLCGSPSPPAVVVALGAVDLEGVDF
jgi:hypothetical protein